MAPVKKKRKRKGAKPRKKARQSLIFWAAVPLFVILTGSLVFLVLGPDDETVLPTNEDVGGYGQAIPYEESGALSGPVIIESQEKKALVAPAAQDFATKTDRPVVAIVIDDMGYNEKNCEALLELDLNLSFAFLPFGRFTAKQAYRANRLGRDVLLHFPMEASDPKYKPGPGTITLGMDPPEIRKIFAENLASVPYAVGINNHMGSRFTQNNRAMQNFMAFVQEDGLFFLDSRTTRNSVGYSLAGKMGVRRAERDIFLDNVRDPQKIIIQLRKLVDVARRQGFAIAIGHPYPETLQALKEYRREISRQVKVVGIEALVR